MHVRVSRSAPRSPFDLSFSASTDGQPGEAGRLILTPAYYLHTLEVNTCIPDGTHNRQIVDALTFYAHGFALHARDHALPGSFAPSEILFHVSPDNAKMRAYVESKGATAESAILYRLPL